MMNYNVSAKYSNAKVFVETNDLHIALEDFWNKVDDAEEVDIINGFTGEVLVHVDENPENTWIVDEWEMILLGSLMCREWGEPAEADPLPPMVADALADFFEAIV